MAFVDLQLHETSHRAARAVQHGRTIGLHTETPQIPPPEIFDPEANPTISAEAPAFPSVPECAIHLELLHSIHRRRQAVQSSTSICFDGQATDEISQSQEVRTQRWDVYLRLAVLRFLKWMHVGDFPPLDVLMVWQACLLNPMYFSRLCSSRKCPQLRSVSFPWKDIHFALQADEMGLQSEEQRASFEVNSGLSDDLLGLFNAKSRDCIFQQISNWLHSTKQLALEPTEPQLPVGNAIAAFLQNNLVADGNEQTVVEIAAAVDRQYKFVEKMEQMLWLRSPAVHGTLRRAISRYEKFVKLLKKYPNLMLVPTLDIDLVWHTHQCAGAGYQEDMEKLTGTFIDHDDKIEPTVLKGGEGETAQLFRLNFGSEYLRCFCWDCETILSELETAKGSGQRMNQKKRKEVARKVASLVSSYRAAEIARQKSSSH